METAAILLAVILFLGATAACVLLFEWLGFGSVLGFIVAGILIGPHTPGPIASNNVHELEAVAELGVVLFMFTIGLEMRPDRLWSMRRLLFGLGSAQMLVSASVVGAYAAFVVGDAWDAALILGLGMAMSSTAIGMTTLQQRGGLSTEHGNATFAILMAQDLWVVPIMALVPLLAHTAAAAPQVPAWQKASLVVGSIAGIVVVGSYLLPAALARLARERQMDAFAVLLFLAVLGAAWGVDHAGISMTLGAFLIGMLLSVSDYRYQIEAMVDPFKSILMGLFFIAVGMSIDIAAIARSWSELLVHVPVVVVLKLSVLLGLTFLFGIGRAAAIRTSFYLSQAGEFAFVLLGAAGAVELLDSKQLTMGMLVVAVSMIVTPLLVKAGDRLATRFGSTAPGAAPEASELERHVVVVGYDAVGQLVCIMLERLKLPYLAFDHDLAAVQRGKSQGRKVHFGDLYSPATQRAAGLDRARAAFVSSSDPRRGGGLALTLSRLHPSLGVFARTDTLREQAELTAKGIHHVDAGFVEGALVRGSALLLHLGVSQDEVDELLEGFRHDNYAQLRAAESN